MISIAGIAAVLFVFLGAAASAHSRPRSYTGTVWVGIKGWGSVKAKAGIYLRPTFRCTNASCPAADGVLHARHVVLVETASPGWKFAGWHGPCKSKRPKCVIDARHAHKDASGARTVRVSARFAPVAPGLTRGNPIPIGTAKSLGNDFTVRVNSAIPNVQLSPPAPPGAEYFAANLNVKYSGGGSSTARNVGTYDAMGSHPTLYNPFGNECPEVPQPPLDYNATIFSGQSTSGWICWTIAADDSAGLELYFGSGTLDFPGTTWFALH